MYPSKIQKISDELASIVFYYTSKITLSRYLLSYAFLCTIVTHSMLANQTFPAIGNITYYFHYLLTFSFLAGVCLNILLYKDFKIYIDKYIILILLYMVSAAISIFLNRSSIDMSLALVQLRVTIFPFIASFAFVQTLNSRHIKTVGNIFIIFAIINIIISFFEIRINLEYPTMSHISGFFTDRNLLARFLVIVNSFVLINYFSQDNKKILDVKLLFSLLILISVTLLYSRSGYIMYIAATFFVIWQTKNKLLRLYGLIIGILIVVLFSAMTYKRVTIEKMNVMNKSDLARISVVKAGINMIKYNPITGVGYGMAKERFNEFEDKSLPGIPIVQTIHNIYINVFAEQGIVGLILYLLFNFGLLYKLSVVISRTNNFKETKNELFCFISLGIFMLHGMVYHTLDYEGLYWVIIALCIITLRDGKLEKTV